MDRQGRRRAAEYTQDEVHVNEWLGAWTRTKVYAIAGAGSTLRR